VLNAANEIAVAAFLEGTCGFLDIERIVDESLDAHECEQLDSIQHVEEVDLWARQRAQAALRSL
jgi:1-deoxy-D-xylulose-5-phosphate reductoisomerase